MRYSGYPFLPVLGLALEPVRGRIDTSGYGRKTPSGFQMHGLSQRQVLDALYNALESPVGSPSVTETHDNQQKDADNYKGQGDVPYPAYIVVRLRDLDIYI